MKSEKVIKKRPCPDCGSRNVKSNGYFNWMCKDCRRYFKKVPRGRFRLKIERPSCPHCGSKGAETILSYGVQWYCKKCNRGWLKHPVGTKRVVPGERPNCPECDEPNPWSQGNRWKCVKCGLSWNKIFRTSQSYSHIDLLKTRIVDV